MAAVGLNAFAVHGAAGTDEDKLFDAGGPRQLHERQAGRDVDRGIAHGILHAFAHVDAGPQVEDGLDFVAREHLSHGRVIRQVHAVEHGLGVHVGLTAGVQVVNQEDVMARVDQGIH